MGLDGFMPHAEEWRQYTDKLIKEKIRTKIVNLPVVSVLDVICYLG